MEREAREAGKWNPVFRRKSMKERDLWKLFSRSGVVKDVFIPRKRNKAGRRYGFVRYDCPVAVEVGIQKTNGLWVKDKELKVKQADFARTVHYSPLVRRNTATRTHGRVVWGHRQKDEMFKSLKGLQKTPLVQDSYASHVVM
ncbi:hypothetical protein Dimus_005275 [Dionaea muscipula]